MEELECLAFLFTRYSTLQRLKEALDGKSRKNVFSLISTPTNFSTPLVMACKNGRLDVALFLVARCYVDIEEVGLAKFDCGIKMFAPPLVCAAAGGHLNIVKMLVKYNASVNSTTDNNCTALYVACFYGHFEIAKYLVQHGADIEIANNEDNTCLMIACLMGHYEISKYLLECGADMNRKNYKGNTALHDCAISGSLDIFKMLLQRGAKSLCDSYGTTPLLTAAIKGHSQVVEYFIHEFNCTKQEKVNALELLGSTFMMDKFDRARTFDCWKRAMELRFEDGGFPLVKPLIRSLIATCVDATEVRTLYQLEELHLNPDEMSIQALLIVERILGPSHPEIFPYIVVNGEVSSMNGSFQKCMKLWMYALDVQLKLHDTFNACTRILLSYFAELFFRMMEDWAVGRNLQRVSFQDILHVFDISVKIIERDLNVLATQKDADNASQLHDTLITAMHLVSVMCILQPHLNIYENTKLKKAVYELVRLNPKGLNDWTPLHFACCGDFSVNGHRFCLFEFPSAEVVDLLLKVGACPNAVDEAKNTPLHVAAMSNTPCSPAVFKALVNHGAHLDFRNHDRKTPLQLAEIGDFLDDYPMRYISLQCLCSQTIRKHDIVYEGIVHEKLKEFLDLH